jgi:hypothetical protein
MALVTAHAADAVRLRLNGTTVIYKAKDEHCPGGGQQPSDDASLACWLPDKDGLTPHSMQHSHKTWMAEDGIPEILAEQRLGHDVPGMRGLYAHVSQRMREELTAALHIRWEESLRERAAIPHSRGRSGGQSRSTGASSPHTSRRPGRRCRSGG